MTVACPRRDLRRPLLDEASFESEIGRRGGKRRRRGRAACPFGGHGRLKTATPPRRHPGGGHRLHTVRWWSGCGPCSPRRRRHLTSPSTPAQRTARPAIVHKFPHAARARAACLRRRPGGGGLVERVSGRPELGALTPLSAPNPGSSTSLAPFQTREGDREAHGTGRRLRPSAAIGLPLFTKICTTPPHFATTRTAHCARAMRA